MKKKKRTQKKKYGHWCRKKPDVWSDVEPENGKCPYCGKELAKEKDGGKDKK